MSQMMDYVSGADFGVGIDTLTPKSRGTAVTFDAPKPVAQVSGQIVAASLQMVKDQENFEESLGISGNAAASFKLVGGSAKVDFAKSSKFQEYSVFLVARVTVANNASQIQNPRFTADATQLLQNGQETRFREQFGDMFVQQVLTGGEYCAVVEIHSKSDEEKQSITQTFEAHGGFAGLGAKVGESLSKEFQDAKQHFDSSVKSFMAGGSGSQTETNPDDVVVKLQNFAAQCTGPQAVVYSMFAQDYNILSMPKAPNWVDSQRAKDTLTRFSKLRRSLELLSNQIDYITQNPGQFINPEKYGLEALSKKVADTLNTLYDAASKCVDNPMNCEIPDMAVPVAPLPSRRPPSLAVPPVILRPAGQSPPQFRLNPAGIHLNILQAAQHT